MAQNNNNGYMDDEEDDENEIAKKIVALEQKAMNFVNQGPQIVSFVPFRGPVNWSWKRTFGMSDEDVPKSFGAAFQSIVTARDEGYLYNGGWSSNYYLLEGFVCYGASFPLRVALLRLENEKTERKQLLDRAAVLGTRLGVTFLLQPFSHTCTIGLLSINERLGMAQAWAKMQETGDPFNGGTSRVISIAANTVTRLVITDPASKWVMEAITKGKFAQAPPVQNPQFTKKTMIKRVYTNAVTLYTNALASLSCGAITYPFECVRLTVESQYVRNSVKTYNGFLDCVQKIWESKGIVGFYRGFHNWMMYAPIELGWPIVATSIARVMVGVIFEDHDDVDNEDTK